jgi:transcriptional regulator with XRE-family HTH domain
VIHLLRKDRLAELRKKRNLYQKDMAKEFGLERSTYGKYETGDIQPPNDMVVRMAEFFSVAVDYLLGRSDNPHSHIEAPLTTEEFLAQQGVTNPEHIAALKNFIELAAKDSELDSVLSNEYLEKGLNVKRAN